MELLDKLHEYLTKNNLIDEEKMIEKQIWDGEIDRKKYLEEKIKKEKQELLDKKIIK